MAVFDFGGGDVASHLNVSSLDLAFPGYAFKDVRNMAVAIDAKNEVPFGVIFTGFFRPFDKFRKIINDPGFQN